MNTQRSMNAAKTTVTRDVNDLDSVMNSIRLGLSADGRTWSSGTYTLHIYDRIGS